MSGPDFDELAEGTAPEERAQLRRAHDLLLAAGPPPELPPYLAEAPRMKKQKEPALTTVPRRRFGAILTAAAGIAAAVFVAGYVVANLGGSSEPTRRRQHPDEADPGRAGAERRGHRRPEGRRGRQHPAQPHGLGLRKLPDGGYYELWLTRVVHGKQVRVVSCGTFVARRTIASRSR